MHKGVIGVTIFLCITKVRYFSDNNKPFAI